MRNLLLTLGLAALCFAMAPGCGGGDDDDDDDDDDDGITAVEGCKQSTAVLCEKIFNCYTQDELDVIAPVFGLDTADCKIKLEVNCSPDEVSCSAGETYYADKAAACVAGYKKYNCDDIRDPNTPEPAACDQYCVRE